MRASQQYDLNERGQQLAPPVPIEGWWRPPGASRRHYYTRFGADCFATLYDSLCGDHSTGYNGSKSFKSGPNEAPINCRTCQRKRLKQLKTS